MTTLGVTYALVLALLAQALPPSAAAQDKAKAKALLQEGLALDKQGDKAQALEKFQAAYAAYPSPKLWFNIGQVERDLGHPVQAAEAFEKFLALVPDAQPGNKKDAKSAVAELGKQLGRLQVRCETGGAEVLVDGKNVGQVPLPPIWATPGSHQLTITHEGFAPASETVEMTAGATALVVMRLAPLALAAPTALPAPAPTPLPPPSLPAPAKIPGTPAALDLSAQPAPAESSGRARPIYATWWFWTGAVAIAAGAVTTVVLLSGKQDSNVPGTALGNHGAFQ